MPLIFAEHDGNQKLTIYCQCVVDRPKARLPNAFPCRFSTIRGRQPRKSGEEACSTGDVAVIVLLEHRDWL